MTAQTAADPRVTPRGGVRPGGRGTRYDTMTDWKPNRRPIEASMTFRAHMSEAVRTGDKTVTARWRPDFGLMEDDLVLAVDHEGYPFAVLRIEAINRDMGLEHAFDTVLSRDDYFARQGIHATRDALSNYYDADLSYSTPVTVYQYRVEKLLEYRDPEEGA